MDNSSSELEKVHVLIGLVSIEWAKLELEQKSFIGILLFRSTEDALTFYDGITSSVIYKQMEPAYLLGTISGKYDDDFRRIYVRINKVGKRRNDVVHSVWELNNPQNIRRVAKTRQPIFNSKHSWIRFKRYTETTETLKKLVSDIEEVTRELSMFSSKLFHGQILKK
ncbi:MAG: hypothetical protein Q8L88_12520 [Bacteroidota bacterium]|nr:hypothetical protein [Bacteroidota bacterium]